jgi:hypothetical protein
LLTTLSPLAPKIGLNVELGDHADVEDRHCGCLLDSLGARTHISNIRSFEKLTGGGVTFARSTLEQILDETLPATFGGSGTDYQVAEEESPDGATRLVLRVHPDVGPCDPAEVRNTLLDALARGGIHDRYMAEMWRGADAIDVRRSAPLATSAGKVLPFHLVKRSSDLRTDSPP